VKITNRKNLPREIVQAIEADAYDKGDADISVTTLIDSPRIRIMREIYRDDDRVSRDAADMLAPLLGSAFHILMSEMEADPTITREERLFGEFQGWRISGQIDRQERLRTRYNIYDYKVTSARALAFHGGDKQEWIQQLNLYRWLMEQNGHKVKKMYIIALAKDHSENKAGPVFVGVDSPISKYEIPKIDVNKLLKDRMDAHQSAQQLFDTTGQIVECTDAERWASPTKWALMRIGNKRATGVYSSRSEAEEAMEKLSEESDSYYVEERPGQNRRCDGSLNRTGRSYCELSSVCEQWKRLKEDSVAISTFNKILGDDDD
jgi:hypothetical protein